jgi:hypothetical protein
MADKRYVGIKEEAEFGEAQDAPMTYDIDVAAMGLDVPDDPNIPIPTLNRFQKDHIPGFYSLSGPMEYPVDINTIGWFLKWGLGGYKYTAGTGELPNVHEFYATPDYELKSFTTRTGKDTFEHVISGCIIDKLNINVEADLAIAKLDMFAQQDTKAELRTELNEPDSELFPMAFYNVSTQLDGADISPDVKSWSWEYGNGVKVEDGRGQGSRFPYYIKPGAGSSSLGIKMEDDCKDKLEDYWGGENGPSIDKHTPFTIASLFNSGVFGEMEVEFPKCYYKKIPTDIKGADPRIPDISIGVEAANLLLNDGTTEVISPVLITLKNFEPEYKLSAF